MKLSLSSLVAILTALGTLVALSIAIVSLKFSLDDMYEEETNRIAIEESIGARDAFDAIIDDIIFTLHEFSTSKEFLVAVAMNDEASAFKQLIKLNSIQLPTHASNIYVNKIDSIGWIDNKRFFPNRDEQDLVLQIEKVIRDSNDAKLVVVAHESEKVFLVVSTKFSLPNVFEPTGVIRAVFDLSKSSHILAKIKHAMRAECMLVYAAVNTLTKIGSPSCITHLEDVTTNIQTSLFDQQVLSVLENEKLIMASNLSDHSLLKGMSFAASENTNYFEVKSEQIQKVITYVVISLLITGVITTIITTLLIRNSIAQLLAFMNQDRLSNNTLFAGSNIKEVEQIADTYQNVKSNLLNEVAERETAETNVEYLSNLLHSTHSRKMESLGVLMAGIAHDFNNILAIIMGNIEIIKRNKEVSKKTLANVNAISDSTDRAVSLVSDLLLYVRKDDRLIHSYNLSEILNGLVEIMSSALGPEIQLSMNIEGNSSFHILMDKDKCEAAIMNLVANAKDAMPNGGKLEIKLSRLSQYIDQAGQFCVLEITDTGTGIDKQTFSRIFDPFFTTKTPGKGVGIGLSLVDNFADQAGGFVKAQSEINVGTSLFVYLPLTDPPLANNDDRGDAEVDFIEGKSFLIVDDELAICEIIKSYIEYKGGIVDIYNDVQTAKETISSQNTHYDVIICDLHMPDGNGIDLIKFAKKHSADLASILISGNTYEISKDSAIQNNVVLQKPFDSKELYKAIESLLA